MTISLRAQPFVQVPEIRLQILPVLHLGDLVHSYRRMAPLAMVGTSQGFQVDQVSQSMKLGFRLSSRAFRYLHEFR